MVEPTFSRLTPSSPFLRFEHIDHVVPHARLPVPHGPEGIDREFVGDSSVSFNFSVHVMEARLLLVQRPAQRLPDCRPASCVSVGVHE